MAARDLCSFITSGKSLDETAQKAMLIAFVKHFNDISVEVQGNALSLLPSLIPHLAPVQLRKYTPPTEIDLF
jgi:hypothetical protein